MSEENTDQEQQELESEETPPEEEDEEKEKEKADPPPKKEVAPSKKPRKRKGKKSKQQVPEKQGPKKKQEAKPPSPRISSKSTFAQIAKELKARRLAQIAHAAAMSKKRKKNRVLRDEEIYTDKDRAAAVNMGTTDIKQSLKLKKKQDKNHHSQIPEEAEPATLLALGNNELRNGDLKTALKFMNKALELNPDDKNGLVARSKCYLSLGEPQLALKDAETALQADRTFVRAIYQKAEALYHLGDFEHSLMHYHRGHRLRPELESFRLGVQKAQEAIENTIGNSTTGKFSNRKPEKTISNSTSSSGKTEGSASDKSRSENDTKRSFSSLGSDKSQRRSKSAAPTLKNSSRFLGELVADRIYLENLLKHPDLVCSNQEAADIIKKQAEEGINFLKSRQEFWRQQKPNASSAAAGRRDGQKEASEPAEER